MHGPGDPPPSASSSPGKGDAGPWVPLSPAEVKQWLPDYEILSLVGRGAMGAVYLAMQAALDRSVAIKLIPPEISADETFARRFAREAQAMARLNHPHITTVHGFGKTSAGHLYFAMEFVDGANLQAMLVEGAIGPARALDIAAQVCEALTYAHANGIVHRDIKPANILVDRDGRVKVADFGIARFDDPGALKATQTGTILGTPDYMAPEQMRGARVDHRADIFSLGIMLYEMLCGEVPRGMCAPPSRRVACGKRVDIVVVKAMQRDPAQRYQSAAEMQADIEGARVRLPRDRARKTRLPYFATIALILAAGIGSALYLLPKFGNRQGAARISKDGWVDLIAGVDVQRDALFGEWRKENGELISPIARGHTTIELPMAEVPAEYDLRYRLTRRRDGAALFFGIRNQESMGGIVVDGWTGNPVKMNDVFVRWQVGPGMDTMAAVHDRRYFGVEQLHEAVIQVRKDHVTFLFDGKPLTTHPHGLDGKTKAIGMRFVDQAFLPTKFRSKPIFAFGVCEGEVVVHSLELKRTSEKTMDGDTSSALLDTGGRAMAPPPPSVPAAPVANVAPSDARRTVEWLLTRGDESTHVMARFPNANPFLIKNPREIPAGDWEIVELWLDRWKAPGDLPPVTREEFVAHTSGLRHLKHLFVRSVELADADFAFLANNPDLEILSLNAVAVGNGMLDHVAGLEKIRKLEISNAPGYTGHGLEKLACAPVLDELLAYGSRFDDEAARALAAFPKLRLAQLERTAITDEGVSALAASKSLWELNVSQTQVTGKSITKLIELRSLKRLLMGSTPAQAEPAALAKFQAERPDCALLQ